MRHLAISILSILLSSTAFAANIPLSATDTGISAENLSDTPMTDPIHMEGSGKQSNQLSLTWAVTPGSSTRIQVTCWTSNLKTSGYGQRGFCDSASPSNCHPDVREFTLSEYTTVSGKKWIKTEWEITEEWAKCSADDPDDGTGTATATGTRSSQ
jgi:hypothetical protein